MYSISKKKGKRKLVNKEELTMLDGFLMGSKNKVFHINDSDVKKITIYNKKLANPLVSKKVSKKYNKLIVYLTEILVDDDDSDDTFREALNQIEKFRLEIKIKYRKFLMKKELELMSKQLKTLKVELEKRYIEIQNSYIEYRNSNSNNRSR